MTLDEFRDYIGDKSLSKQQITELYNQNNNRFNAEVDEYVKQYEHVDIDVFLKRIGGYGKVENMQQINKILDSTELVNGKLVPKKVNNKTKENIEEWKRGFMEGFKEAWKRLHPMDK